MNNNNRHEVSDGDDGTVLIIIRTPVYVFAAVHHFLILFIYSIVLTRLGNILPKNFSFRGQMFGNAGLGSMARTTRVVEGNSSPPAAIGVSCCCNTGVSPCRSLPSSFRLAHARLDALHSAGRNRA